MRVSERGQITIPKKLRKMYGLDRNVDVEVLPDGDQLAIRKKPPRRHPVDRLIGIGKLPFGKSVDDYIEQARGR